VKEEEKEIEEPENDSYTQDEEINC